MNLLAPGIGLLNRLRYSQKFLLICLVFLAPLVLMGGLLISELNAKIDLAAKERLGVEYMPAVRAPIQHIQQHRGMTAAFLNGDASFRDKMLAKQQLIDGQLAALQAMDRRLGTELRTEQRVAELVSRWNNIKTAVFSYKPAESFEVHSKLVSELLDLITYVADTSNLILDPELDSYYLMDLAVVRLPNLTEAMGQSRAIAAGVAANGAFNQQSWSRLAIRLDRMQETEKVMTGDIATITRENAAVGEKLRAPADHAAQTVGDYSAMLGRMLNADHVTVSAPEIFDKSTKAINGVFEFYDLIIPTLDELLAKRVNNAQNTKNITLAVMASVLLAMLYIFLAFYHVVQHGIRELKSGLEQIASGNLTTVVTLHSRDELGHVADHLNQMTNRFRDLVGKVLTSTQHVSAAAEELSAVTEQTNQAINEQLTQTDQVATAVTQMSSTVQEVARSAASTSEATHSAQQQSHSGHNVVTDTVDCINDLANEIRSAASVVNKLGEDSQDIGKVLDVIRTIAEQTNLLALNAAIEAARAGEQGRGFAVVADEVRTLAGRTQQSTQEIQAMIERLQQGARDAVKAMETSESKTSEGVAMVARAGEALTAITNSISTIADMSTQIAAAAEQQSAVAEEINRNVTQIAQVCDQNAAASNQTSSSSNQLAQLAVDLQGMVSVFRVA